ncbi:hypothetical protein [Clostridium porci]|uniref:Uncharacterized protein n=1 Tax=Clostridium porci TaxID=2605778 RepID=A0A7X2NNV3_9CLOT|nr:hypothetical protein [Clostridium porci]MSS38325.1 hypothetical protein [Clostridium porci]
MDFGQIKTETVKQRAYDIKPFKRILIGDPSYLEKIQAGTAADAKRLKKFVLDKKITRSRSKVAKIEVKLVHSNMEILDWDTWEIGIAVVEKTDDDEWHTVIMETLFDNKYHPELIDQIIELGCDTANFYVSVDGKSDEICPGADGTYGTAILYKHDLATFVSLSLSTSLFDEKDIEKMIEYFFEVTKKSDWENAEEE